MKKFLLILILPCLLSFSLLVKELYTQKQVEILVSKIVDRVYFFSSENGLSSKVITLSQLLRINKTAFQRKDNGWHPWNVWHKNWTNWKNSMMYDSDVVNKALNRYGKMAIKQINSQIKYHIKYSQDVPWKNASLWSYTVNTFWKHQKTIFDKYIYTIDKLLNLNDEELSYFIMSNDESNLSSSYELYEWAVSKKIISGKIPHNKTKYIELNNINYEEGVHDGIYQFPADLLFLTKRTCLNNSSINPRDFLETARMYALELQAIIYNLGYW